jgi:LTXXQ motif family protein
VTPQSQPGQNAPGQRLQPPRANQPADNRMLRNPAFANRAAIGGDRGGNALARATFAGSFANKHWKHHHFHKRHHKHFFPIVIGWVGPVFWPYAYSDFVGYTFYPHAYDTFWPYAYDDVYEGMFGRYAYRAGGGGAYAAVGGRGGAYAAVGGRGGGGRPPASRGVGVGADLCSGQTAGLTDWPIEQIAQTVQPDDSQRAALDELKAATATSLDILKASCPTELPTTPTGRLEAMHKRLTAMLQAVQTVRPALDKLYHSLNDEQRARFNAIGSDDAQQQTRRDLAQVCSERAAGIAGLPTERIERAVRPDAGQRGALTELQDATAQAAELLKAECPTYRALTPVGRLEAMEQRLDAMLRAVQTVQPALERFYGALSDEQKERFNRLSPAQG